MAKISVHGGPSNAAADTASADEFESASADEFESASAEEAESASAGEAESASAGEAESGGEEPNLPAEVVAEGTVDEVLAWTEDDPQAPARLLSALDAENAKATPRVTLIAEVQRRLDQF